jgi:uncharacterized membrane-anchored protein
MKQAPFSHDPSIQQRRQSLKRLPEITIYFWIIKLLTTGMGETTSDYLAHQMKPILAVAFTGIGLLIALVLQFTVRCYIPWVYWLAILMVAIFGTMAADAIHVGLGVSYPLSTAGFAIVLVSIFLVWYLSEKTLSINQIHTTRREIFYWATVMATFALGTAAGDMTASSLELGYFTSGLLFGGLFILSIFAYWSSRFYGVGAFWFAYILTRPLGASFADLIGKPILHGGLGFGTGRISIVLGAIIFVFVVWLTFSRQGNSSTS